MQIVHQTLHTYKYIKDANRQMKDAVFYLLNNLKIYTTTLLI